MIQHKIGSDPPSRDSGQTQWNDEKPPKSQKRIMCGSAEFDVEKLAFYERGNQMRSDPQLFFTFPTAFRRQNGNLIFAQPSFFDEKWFLVQYDGVVIES